MKNNQIIIDNLSVSKRETDILKDVNLHLHESNSYLLYGRNGAGKTTILRCIVGLEEMYRGDIQFKSDEKSVPNISYLPEEISVSDYLIVKDYINSFMLLYRDMKLLNQDFYHELVEIFEINKYENKTFGSLSKGMKKMILLCISLMKRSDVLVLDEPFEGLDIIIKEKLTKFILEQADNNKIVLVSSHEIAEVFKHFNYIIGLKAGSITSISESSNIRNYQELLTQV